MHLHTSSALFSDMEKNSLKQEEPTGSNSTLVEISSYDPDKKNVLPESNTGSHNLGKIAVKEDSKEGISVMVNKNTDDIASESSGTDGPALQADVSQLKLDQMALSKASCSPEDFKEHKNDAIPLITDNVLISKGESSQNSFTPSMSDLPVDDSITFLLSSCTLKDNPKDKGPECQFLPQRSLTARTRKKLLVFNLSGILADIVFGNCASCRVQKIIMGRTVVKRPFCDDFLKFCFENFDVGIWSSRRQYNLDPIANYIMGKFKNKLLFRWDQTKCTDTGFKTIENDDKPLFLKELKKLWNKEVIGLPWKKGEFSPSNTLLLDDSPYTALLNPPHTAIFPDPYLCNDGGDKSLGPEGDIRVYLEQLVKADDVQQYVKGHPLGQSAITALNPHWDFYSQIIKRFSTQ